MKTDILRERFLEFFKSRKHKIVESDSLIPKDDPTILFTPAGMNQFKKQFLGIITDFSRAASSQRCLRTDDLDKVGKTAGHHTFFEMLGNFSFGDYFKKEAIAYAWEFLTEALKIKKEKLWVSVYKDDDEAYGIWRDKIKIPAEKIVKLGDKENFWPSEAKQKGPNGPCGPCSEIFFDWGSNTGCKKKDCSPACDCGRFVEVWNLVFTQFNRKANGKLAPLPKKNIDTGMGLERLAAVMQGARNNFETDLFQPIIKEIAAGIRHPASGIPKDLLYAIADHIRAITFAIYDGLLPSNEGRGYVIRKILRKSILHLWALGIKEPFLYKLVPPTADAMKAPYPQLKNRRENIAQIVLAEEKGFISTLNLKDELLKDKFADFSKNEQDPERAGRIAFELYDTYGIPLELTQEWLNKQLIKISRPAFERQLKEQKERSKAQSAMKGDVFDFKDMVLGAAETKFLGYKEYSVKTRILKIIKGSLEAKKISKGDEARIVLAQTPFYPESGGQVGDSGEIVKGKNIFEVIDTKRADKAIIHIGRVKEGSFKTGGVVLAGINIKKRLSIARNHTATHLLQAALRKILGAHVRQQGSLVDAEKLRFDFTHFKDIAGDEIGRIEEEVNGYIMDNFAVQKKQVSLLKAQDEGALAFFADKYENKVRMISVSDFSKELCGGTHLEYTGQAGFFKIIQECSVAAGIRRIEAVTGVNAFREIKKEKESLFQEVEKRLAQIKTLEKQVNLQKIDSVKNSIDALLQAAFQIDSKKIIAKVLENFDMDSLRKTVDSLKEKTDNSIIALGSSVQGRAYLVMGITADLCQQGLDASKLIRDMAALIGGSGGGRKDFAQAGGNKPENLEKALEELKNLVKTQI